MRVLPSIFASMSALRLPDQSLPDVELPSSPTIHGARRRRRSGTPAPRAKSRKTCLHTLATARVLHDMDLPTINDVESAVGDVCDPHDMPGVKVESAVGGEVCEGQDMNLPTVNDVESAVGDVCDPHDMVKVESAVGDVCSPWKRTCTADDLRRVAARFGEDLACADLYALPYDWLSLPSAKRFLIGEGVSSEKIDVLEVYAGSARWSRACEAAMLRAGLSHGVDILSGDQWDLTTKGARRLLWAMIVVCDPKWVHSGFPCTFWSTLAHCNRKSTTGEEEESRTCALVHVILTCQLARWQHKRGYHMSFENPPTARSWKLDIVKDTMVAIGAAKYKSDSCAWGHVDPVSGKPVKKEQCVASTANLSSLVRRCTCYSGPGRCPSGIHERVHGALLIPSAVGGKATSILRSKWAGAYPEDLCREWAQVVRASIEGI